MKILVSVMLALLVNVTSIAVGQGRDHVLEVIEPDEGTNYKFNVVKAVLDGDSRNCDKLKKGVVSTRPGGKIQISIPVDADEDERYLIKFGRKKDKGTAEGSQSLARCFLYLTVDVDEGIAGELDSINLWGFGVVQPGHVFRVFSKAYYNDEQSNTIQMDYPASDEEATFINMAPFRYNMRTFPKEYKCGAQFVVGVDLLLELVGDSKSESSSLITISSMRVDQRLNKMNVTLRTIEKCAK